MQFAVFFLTSRWFCVLVVAIFIELSKNSVDCSNKLLVQTATNSRRYAYLPVICDDEYTSKYMSGQSQIFESEPMNSDDQPIFESFDGEERPHLVSDFDIVLTPNDDGIHEFLNHENDGPSDFMNHLLTEMRYSRKQRLFNFTDASFPLDSDNNLNVSPKLRRNRNGQKLRKIKKLTGRRRNSMNSKPSHRFLRNTTPLLHSTKRKNLRKHGWRSNDVEEYQIKPYNMFDTFDKMFDARRGIPTEFRKSLRRAEWSEDSCKSMRRIVGGYTVTSPEELPYMVFVDSGCGGAIIGKTWVLTAAHCADDDNPSYVYVGSLDLLGGCQYLVEEVYLHPNFAVDSLEYDIGLLKITPSFIYSPAIKPIALSDSPARDATCGVVAGWGASKYEGSPQDTLQITMIPIVSNEKCAMFNLSKEQFCAGFQDARTDTCQGDSGGPFVVNNVVVGIVSFGYQCATPEVPGVYVDVSYHRNWIRDVSGI